MCLLLYALWQLTLTLVAAYPSASDPTVVDLGYAKHRVSFTNVTEAGRQINVYQNIRFAQPPTGELRFLRPRVPPPATSDILDGSYDFDTRCVSAVPDGAGTLFPGLNGTTFGGEDCLFLDVYTPGNITDIHGLPVLHWIYGSGYSFGSKETFLYPLSLFDTLIDNDEPFVLVASNYRMGLYGWMASPFEDMQPNAGLWDGYAALQWTQQYISKFGGDPSRITTFGQSSSAAMIELLATSENITDLPFQQAFIASPALSLKRNVTERRQYVYEAVLNATNCSTLGCLRSVSETDLAEANRYLQNDVGSLSGGGNVGPGIGFGPVVDGELVTDLPIALPNLSERLSRLDRLMTSNMGNEGAIVSSDQGMPDAFPGLARRILPSASNETISEIQGLYHYPPDEPEQLAWYWTSDAVFTCNGLAISKAAANITHRYVMTIPPAWHGFDVFYIMFKDNETTPVHDLDTSKNLQRLLGTLLYGNENTLKDDWPIYGANQTFLNITADGFQAATEDDGQLHRCEVIEAAFKDPANGI